MILNPCITPLNQTTIVTTFIIIMVQSKKNWGNSFQLGTCLATNAKFIISSLFSFNNSNIRRGGVCLLLLTNSEWSKKTSVVQSQECLKVEVYVLSMQTNFLHNTNNQALVQENNARKTSLKMTSCELLVIWSCYCTTHYS
jgi:hypothetical protein